MRQCFHASSYRCSYYIFFQTALCVTLVDLLLHQFRAANSTQFCLCLHSVRHQSSPWQPFCHPDSHLPHTFQKTIKRKKQPFITVSEEANDRLAQRRQQETTSPKLRHVQRRWFIGSVAHKTKEIAHLSLILVRDRLQHCSVLCWAGFCFTSPALWMSVI